MIDDGGYQINQMRAHRVLQVRRSLSYKIFHGDATLCNSYTDALKGELADLLITDPPYCILTRRRKNGDLRDDKLRIRKLDNSKVVRKFENIAEYRAFTRKWLKACIESALKPDANLIIWTNYLGKSPISDVTREFGYEQVEKEYMWAKLSKNQNKIGLYSSECSLRVYEVALVFRRPSRKYDNNSNSTTWSVITGYHPTGSLAAHKHPCHKPVEALLPLVQSWMQPQQLVLDPFAGSGSILKAASLCGSRGVGLEICKDWVSEEES